MDVPGRLVSPQKKNYKVFPADFLEVTVASNAEHFVEEERNGQK